MKKIKLFSVIILTFIIATAISHNAHADILQVVNMTELYKCYTSYGNMKKTPGKIDTGLGIGKIVGGGQDVQLTTGYGHTIKDNNLSCKELIKGYSSGKQSYSAVISGAKDNMNQNEARSVLKKLGYEPTSTSSTGSRKTRCVQKKYQLDTSQSAGFSFSQSQTTALTHQVCVSNIDENNKFTADSEASINKIGDGTICDFDLANAKKTVEIDCANNNFLSRGGCGDVKITTGGAWSTFKQGIYSELSAHRNQFTKVIATEGYSYTGTYKLLLEDEDHTENETDVEGGDLGVDWEFAGGTAKKAAETMLSENSSWKAYADIKFEESEKSTLHQWYFKNYFGASLICDGDSEYSSLTATSDTVEAKNVTSKKCFAKASKNTGKKVKGAKADLTWYKEYSFAELVNAMTEEELTGAASVTDPDEDDPTSSEKREIDCYSNAGALGWLICPIIEKSSEGVHLFYTGLVEPYLQIDAVLFDSSSLGGATVQHIWGIFQGFANLAFVIVFLFVIFSQLTGVGIDNYGIKKILPKLIIGAVLINMSYLICQLAVDLSNILGRAVGSMFKNMAGDLDKDIANLAVNLNPSKAADVTGKFEAGVLVIVGIAAVLGVGAFLAAGPAILIPALLALLSVVVGVLFLFIMLALRQAVAVILVVISPMAFAAYILPNTKKIFDKWWEAFKGMIIAYPICSALVYGGDFVSKILLVSEGGSKVTSLGIILSAAAVAIAPIFFIPSVIKKGMSGIIGVGNMINKMQGGVNSAVRSRAGERLNQSRLNDYQTRRKEERGAKSASRRKEKDFRRAQRTIDKYSGKSPNELNSRQRAKYNIARRNDMAYRKEQSELSDDYYSTLSVPAISRSIESAFNSGDLEMVTSGMNQLGQIDQGELLDIVQKLSKTDKWKNMSDKERTSIMSTLRGQKGNPILQAYAKMLGQEQSGSIRSMTDDSMKQQIQKKIREAGDGAVQGLDKDTANWMANNSDASWATSFTGDQIGSAIGSAPSGAQADGLARVIAKRQESGVDDRQFVSGEQLANGANITIASALSGSKVAEIGSIATGETAAPQAQIREKLKRQIGDINANSELAAKTNEAFAQAADIKRNQPQEVRIV